MPVRVPALSSLCLRPRHQLNSERRHRQTLAKHHILSAPMVIYPTLQGDSDELGGGARYHSLLFAATRYCGGGRWRLSTSPLTCPLRRNCAGGGGAIDNDATSRPTYLGIIDVHDMMLSLLAGEPPPPQTTSPQVTIAVCCGHAGSGTARAPIVCAMLLRCV